MNIRTIIITVLFTAVAAFPMPGQAQIPACRDYGAIADPTLGVGVDVGGLGGKMVISGDIAYFAASSWGLQIVRVTTPHAAAVLGTLDTPGIAEDLAVAGDRVYLVDQGSAVHIIDVRMPTAPSLLGTIPVEGAEAVYIHGTVLFVAWTYGVTSFDVTIPAAPVFLGGCELEEPAFSIAGAGPILMVGGHRNLHALDVSLPHAITELGSLPTEYEARDILLELPRVRYLVAYSMLTADFSNPSAPVLMDEQQTPMMPIQMVSDGGDRLHVSCGLAGVRTFDLTDPWRPEFLGGWSSGSGCTSVGMAGTTLWTRGGYGLVQAIDPLLLENYMGLGTLDTSIAARDVAVEGDIACVADHESGLQVVDISDPAAPELLATDPIGYGAQEVAFRNGLAYVANWSGGLRILDLADPANPVLLGVSTETVNVNQIDLEGTLAFVDIYPLGVGVYDVSDPTAPVLRDTVPEPGNTIGLDADGDRLYVAAGNRGLVVYDVSDPDDLVLVGEIETPQAAYDVVARDDYAFIADLGTLQVADVSDPTNPVLVAEYDTTHRVRHVTLNGNLLYYGDYRGTIGALDVSDPLVPRHHGMALTTGGSVRMAADDDVLYIATGDGGLENLPAQCLKLSSAENPVPGAGSRLMAARPNPFNPATVIPFTLDRRQKVRITVHDVRGRLVTELLHAERPAGDGEVRWNGRDQAGRAMPSGVYFARLATARGTDGVRMVLIK